MKLPAAALVAPLVVFACSLLPARPVVTCGDLDTAICDAVYPIALGSLTPQARAAVAEVTMGPSATVICTAGPGCEPQADVAVRFRDTEQALVITVSRLPDGRLIAETY